MYTYHHCQLPLMSALTQSAPSSFVKPLYLELIFSSSFGILPWCCKMKGLFLWSTQNIHTSVVQLYSSQKLRFFGETGWTEIRPLPLTIHHTLVHTHTHTVNTPPPPHQHPGTSTPGTSTSSTAPAPHSTAQHRTAPHQHQPHIYVRHVSRADYQRDRT